MPPEEKQSAETRFLAEIYIPDERELLDDGTRMAIAVTIKQDGGKWRVHKSDADKNFPSDLHADRVDAPEKLDVYTGEVWSPITKQRVRLMPKKSMRYFFNQLSKTKETNLQLLMADKSKFNYLSN